MIHEIEQMPVTEVILVAVLLGRSDHPRPTIMAFHHRSRGI